MDVVRGEKSGGCSHPRAGAVYQDVCNSVKERTLQLSTLERLGTLAMVEGWISFQLSELTNPKSMPWPNTCKSFTLTTLGPPRNIEPRLSAIIGDP
jgi:hypothetical protein